MRDRSEITGFNAYIFYIRTRVFFNNKKYNILDNKINKNKYINNWNKKRANKDGLYFEKIENYLPQQRIKFIRFFSYYYLKDTNFYVKDVIDNNFKLYEYNEFQLQHIKEGLKTDFRHILNFADKNNRAFKKVFIGKNLPAVFKLYDTGKISVYSLIIFNEIFHLIEKVKYDKLNFLDKERYTFYQDKIFNKFKFVIYDQIFNKKYDWVDILKGV